MLDTSAGNGTLDGTTLTMTTLGTFVIKGSTPINDVHDKGEHTLTITVNKATPNSCSVCGETKTEEIPVKTDVPAPPREVRLILRRQHRVQGHHEKRR